MLMFDKVVHFIWLVDPNDPKPIPESDVANIESFRTNAPDWDLWLWTNLPLEDDTFTRVCQPPTSYVSHVFPVVSEICDGWLAAAADIMRLEILYQNGGVYFDTDVWCVKDFKDVLSNVELACSWEHGCHNIGNFFLAGQRRHPAFLRCLNLVRSNIANAYRSGGRIAPVADTGPTPVARTIAEHPECHLFPYEVFSPWNPQFEFDPNFEFPDATRCVHLFDGKWTQMETRVPVGEGDPLRGW